MAKYSGKIGFAVQKESSPGVWTETVIERPVYGEIISFNRRLRTSGNLNDDIEITNQLSVIADPFAYENFCAMRYATFMGAKWKITDIEVEHPRLRLSLGGLYND